MSVTYATITIEMSKAGLHCICEELDKDVFCTKDLEPLVELINDAEICCNPDTEFRLKAKGKRAAEKMKREELEKQK